MNATQHALLARALIDACGGVDACCKPTTRIERSQMYAYRTIGSGAYMPADVIDALEKRCANPVYSSFIASQISVEPDTDCLVDEAADVDEAANDVWRFLRRIGVEPRPFTENERREAERLVQRLERETAELRTLLARMDGQ